MIMYKIAIDAMGGDNAPDITVAGSIEALRTFDDIEIILVGMEEKIKPLLSQAQDVLSRIEIVDAREVILNTESPVMAIRRKLDSSLVKAYQLVREGKAAALVSAGSTGAIMAGGIFRLGRLQGVDRPALAAVFYSVDSQPTVLVDTGANVDCRPEWLEQFAHMGAAYAKKVLDIENPRVGLLNIGEEDEKGNALTKAAGELLKTCTDFTYTGNVESRAMMDGVVDVIVCDGFHGNLVIKAAEGMAKAMMTRLKAEMYSSIQSKLGAMLCRNAFRNVKKAFSTEEVGSAPLLGVQGAVVKAHGNSSQYAFFCSIRQARKMLTGGMVESIGEEILKAASKPDTPA